MGGVGEIQTKSEKAGSSCAGRIQKGEQVAGRARTQPNPLYVVNK
ncbi:hypothetical protein COLO4_07612 [Corchorus olitorius]|uniref:Uncharacterized protein n=1 Tax=Corchorus olitorius TaxID=93759 RepID=A0A1R3KJ60_9ROSI|nr:hypothetical protein COLO4_07612 [Corchorus olitorius]